MAEDNEEYKGNQVPVIINIPDNTVKLEINAKIIDENDEFLTVQSVLKLADITEARIAGEEWEFENVKYCLTDEARAELERKNG